MNIGIFETGPFSQQVDLSMQNSGTKIYLIDESHLC